MFDVTEDYFISTKKFLNKKIVFSSHEFEGLRLYDKETVSRDFATHSVDSYTNRLVLMVSLETRKKNLLKEKFSTRKLVTCLRETIRTTEKSWHERLYYEGGSPNSL